MFDNDYEQDFAQAENSDANRALREGLYDLPTPEVSGNFEAAIQSALLPHPAWWHSLWTMARPALPTAVGTLIVMLLLVNGAQKSSFTMPTFPSPTFAPAAMQKPFDSASAAARGQGIEKAWVDIDLSNASLYFIRRSPRLTMHKSG